MTLDMWTPHGPMVCFGKRAGSVDQGVYLTSTQDADHSTCAGWAQRRGVGSNAQVALLIASPPRRNGAALDRSAHRPATAVASTRDTGTIHSWDPPMVGVGEGAVVPRPHAPPASLVVRARRLALLAHPLLLHSMFSLRLWNTPDPLPVVMSWSILMSAR